jgi:hypothetical protein
LSFLFVELASIMDKSSHSASPVTETQYAG